MSKASASIRQSVGNGGVNHHGDVMLIQRLLNTHGICKLKEDGHCGPRTQQAIAAFQKRFMHDPHARVDAGGLTWKMLQRHPQAAPVPVHVVAGNGSRVNPVNLATATINHQGLQILKESESLKLMPYLCPA